ncbi:MAG TPA: hypothetical protein VGN12_19510 [Pirellulales bacterium]
MAADPPAQQNTAQDFTPVRSVDPKAPNTWSFDCDMTVQGDITKIVVWIDTKNLEHSAEADHPVKDDITLYHKDGRLLGKQEVFPGQGSIHVTEFTKHEDGETFTFTSADQDKFDVAKDALTHGFQMVLGTMSNPDIKLVDVAITYTPTQK